MKRDDIEISVSNGRLTIKAEKKEERDKNHYLSERRYGSFARSFDLPDGIDASGIKATKDDGVLKIALPKTPEAKQAKKTIPITSAVG